MMRMSTKEMVYSMIDRMSEEQLNALFVLLSGTFHEEKPKADIIEQVDAVCGILHEYANPDLIPFEKDAWAEAAVERERRVLEEMNNKA